MNYSKMYFTSLFWKDTYHLYIIAKTSLNYNYFKCILYMYVLIDLQPTFLKATE